MKAELVVYRVVSFLLLPIAVLFGISALFGLLSVLVNPSALFGVVMLGAVVFYLVCTFIFQTTVISGARHLTNSLRNRIRISAFITAFFCIMIIYAHISILSNPDVLTEPINLMMKQPGLPGNATRELLEQAIKTIFNFFMVISLMLLLHIIMSFRLLHQYNEHNYPKMDIED